MNHRTRWRVIFEGETGTQSYVIEGDLEDRSAAVVAATLQCKETHGDLFVRTADMRVEELGPTPARPEGWVG